MLEWILIAIALLALIWASLVLASRRYHLENRGFTITPGLLMWRTKRGLGFIDRVAGFSKRGWCAYGTVAAVVGVCMMIFVFVMLILNLIFILMRPVAVPGVTLVLPGMIPGLTIIAWLVAISTILLVHELSHGFLLRAQGLQAKSMGGMLLVAIPGAFVEPNEKQLMRAPVSKRLRMFAAGSMGNFVLALLCLVIVLALLVPKPGVYVYGVYKNYPAVENFASGTRIYALDNVQIETEGDYWNFFKNKHPGDNVLVKTEEGENLVTLESHPTEENIGVLGLKPISATSRWKFANPLFTIGVGMTELLGSPIIHPYVYDALVPWFVIDILKWVFILNFGIGLFNLLPARPLDGGYMLEAIIEHRSSKEKARRVSRILSYIVLMLILMNIVPAFLR